MRVLDVGSGPGHLAYEIAQVIGSNGLIEGVDSAEGLVETGRRRCSGLENARFTLGDAYDLPYDDGTFDAAMSSQVFEYLDDVPKALGEMFRFGIRAIRNACLGYSRFGMVTWPTRGCLRRWPKTFMMQDLWARTPNQLFISN
jgi:ubiquinone/menaquinone biosynthesis C-methylase UbiE